MKKNTLFVILLTVIILLSVLLAIIFFTTNAKNDLKFSNTQEWDIELEPYLFDNLDPQKKEEAAVYIEKITLPPPPSNNSPETKKELELLKSYQENARNNTTIQHIKNEVYLENFNMGSFYLNDPEKEYTRALILAAREELSPVLFFFKNKFDRVRPSFLDPDLTTVVSIPGHPAYPSGHSTEEHLFAYILSEIDPSNRESHLNKAATVAKNREIAGLHYPSDTEAGRILAEQFFSLFTKTEKYKTLLEAAQTEWK